MIHSDLMECDDYFFLIEMFELVYIFATNTLMANQKKKMQSFADSFLFKNYYNLACGSAKTLINWFGNKLIE